MRLEIEEITSKQPVLIVSKNHKGLEEVLKKELSRFQTEIFVSPYIPKNLTSFDYIFILDDTTAVFSAIKLAYKRIIYIKVSHHVQVKKLLQFVQKEHIENIKVIDITYTTLTQELIEKILWFAFSKTKELFLNLAVEMPQKNQPQKHLSRIDIKKIINFKRIIIFSVIVLFFTIILFIPFLIGATYQIYKSANFIRQEKPDETEYSLDVSNKLLNISKNLYRFPRPFLSVFSVSLYIDNVIEIDEKAATTIQVALSLQKNGQRFTQLLLKKTKSQAEKDEMELRVNKMNDDIGTLQDSLVILQQKIPTYNAKTRELKTDLGDSLEILAKLKKLLAYTDTFLAKGTQKKYLLLFANNMELRPGGGFIGSFGIMSVKDYTLEDIKIYDVYDADGQLKAHIEPPIPIKKYLNVQHWFLRDSAFSPDFLTNYTQAKFFLDKEMNERNFSGAILLTTTAVQNLLSGFGTVYLPDFNEEVNDKNFYIKTQYYAEKDFFPGSTQKKSFLGSLARNLFINVETASMKDLLKGLKKSLDEKQIVLYIDHPPLQEVIDSFYWSGRTIEPRCTTPNDNCIVDYLFPIDANVGGNKANFFITRLMNLDISVDKEGILKHKLSIQFKNDAYAEVYPGGAYHNYFQLLLPKGTVISSMTQDGVQLDDTDESDTDFKRVGMAFLVKPRKTTTIEVMYKIPQQLPKGRTNYQLIVQKQIGSSNNDFTFSIDLPDKVHPVNQNFSPLVKNDKLLYNTNLGADKIFYIELLKE